MSEPGNAMMGTAVACQLLEGIDLSGARGALVPIAASKGTFKPAESRNAMNTIRRHAADDAYLIYGTTCDKSLGDPPRMSVVQSPALRTGTDNLPILAQPAVVAGARLHGAEYAQCLARCAFAVGQSAHRHR